ncbi:MAG: CpaD family pilus assembly protein [Magnetospirillum sp.]|nr:CpaD family pilus assembly protein [Magnetospirillum sp.]
MPFPSLRSCAVLASCVLVLAACEPTDLAEFDYRQRYPLTVEQRAASASVAQPGDGQGLSPTDRAVLADLAAEHLRRGAGPVAVTVTPSEAGGGEAGARAFGALVATTLAESGIDPARVVVALAHAAAAGNPGTAAVTVPVWMAKVPTCGVWVEGINPDWRNQDSANFGCSIQRNTGLMVDNPADLLRARQATGRDGARGYEVMTKYSKGEATSAAKEVGADASTTSTSGSK